MSSPRPIFPGQTYLITRSCTQRQFLLRPDRMTNRIFLYCLADAAQRYGIRVLAWVMMSNHYHAVVDDPEGRLPAFLEHFHKFTAKALNARWGRWENFWSSEPTCVVRLVTPEDVFDKVVYVLANPVAADIVDRVADWPGASALPHLDGKPLSVPRAPVFFRKNGPMPATAGLSIVGPDGVDRNAWVTRVREALSSRERAVRERRLQNGIRVVGRKAVRRLSPFGRPSTSTPRRNLRPCIACKDPNRRKTELLALQAFRQQHARARALLTAGDRTVRFPLGSYRWRMFVSAPVATEPALSVA